MYLCMRWEHITSKWKGVVRHTGNGRTVWLGPGVIPGGWRSRCGKWSEMKRWREGSWTQDFRHYLAWSSSKVVHHADSSVYIRLNSDTKPWAPLTDILSLCVRTEPIAPYFDKPPWCISCMLNFNASFSGTVHAHTSVGWQGYIWGYLRTNSHNV